jgi:hypothetical protein
MNIKHPRAVIPGIAGLILVIVSAFTPWFEWSVQNWPETPVNRTTVWGPPGFVLGTPQFGSVQLLDGAESVVNFSVLAYLVTLLFALASPLLVLFGTLSERWPRRRAAWAVAVGGIIAYVGIAVAVGFGGFIVSKTMRQAAAQSTWIVTFQLQRWLIAGPLLLLAGAALGIGGCVGVLYSHRVKA